MTQLRGMKRDLERPKMVPTGIVGKNRNVCNILALTYIEDIEVSLTINSASSEYACKYKKVMQKKYQLLSKSETLQLKDAPRVRKLVGNTWEISLKTLLISKSFSRTHGIK